MSINACIYDSRRILAGCITDSVIEKFRTAFEDLKKKYFGDIVTPVLGIMEKSLIESTDKMSADFLNCLKLLSRKYRDDAPIGFVQEVSRVYHYLVRYCCSQAVYDEVLQETIEQFRDAGLDYVGGNSQGFDQSNCVFEYKGKKITVTMRERECLYNMWNSTSEFGTTVKVQDGGDEYTDCIAGSPSDIAEEIVRFIDIELGTELDEPDELECNECDDEYILNELISAIKQLVLLDE